MTSSGSKAFDQFRDTLAANPELRAELESALDLNVRRVNPTDRANRFGSGGAVEWILASAAFAAGVLTIPGGHNSNGFDLRDVRDDARGLWSVKNTTKRSNFRLTNGIGGAGAGLVEPVIFLSPALPGLVLVHPAAHPDVAARVEVKADATVLPFGVVADHAVRRPECVVPCRMPANPGTGSEDPWKDYVESLLSSDRFPRLSELFVAAKPVSGTLTSELQRLIEQRDSGAITAAQFDALVLRLGL